jgi:Xaa-Pro aminopeptidase
MHDARIQKVLQRLPEAQLDALLVSSLPNIFYLSGFTGSTAMLLLTADKRYFLTDFRYHEQVGQQVKGGFELVDNTGKKLVADILPGLPGGDQLKRIGFESDHVTHATYGKLAEAEGREFVPTSSWVEDLRMVKDELEVELIREAVLLNERIFTELLGLIGPGVTEADLAAEIGYRAMKAGALGNSFSPIVASGANAAKPHAGFSTQELVAGAPLTFDMGVALNGYCSDMTRTVFYKDCPAQWELVYNTVREAKDMVTAQLRPGMLGREADAIAREHISAAGHGDHFGHGLGHGVGIEVHEGPRLAAPSEQKLAVGNMVTNEPGIYLPGEGGVRIEDILLLTDSGCDNINTLPTDIVVIG